MTRSWMAWIVAVVMVAGSALAGMAFGPGDPKACNEEDIIEDDGTAESSVGNTLGAFPLVKCMAPSAYPSYLFEISAYLTTSTTIGPMQWIVYTAPNASSEPSSLFYLSEVETPTADDWNVFDSSVHGEFQTPINSGVWCFGIKLQGSSSTVKVGADESASDGHDWTLLGEADWRNTKDDLGASYNLMIRALSKDCAPDVSTVTTTTTTIPGTDDDADDDDGDDDGGDDDGGDDDGGGDDDADDDADDDDDTGSLGSGSSGDDDSSGCCG